MEKFTTAADLKIAIKQLEEEQFENRILLKEHIILTYESLRPINIVKGTIKELCSDNELKAGMIDNMLGWTTGYIARRFLIGSSTNFFKKLTGKIIEKLVAAKVSKTAEGIISFTREVLNNAAGQSDGM